MVFHEADGMLSKACSLGICGWDFCLALPSPPQVQPPAREPRVLPTVEFPACRTVLGVFPPLRKSLCNESTEWMPLISPPQSGPKREAGSRKTSQDKRRTGAPTCGAEGWRKKLWDIYTTKYYLATQKDKVGSFL